MPFNDKTNEEKSLDSPDFFKMSSTNYTKFLSKRNSTRIEKMFSEMKARRTNMISILYIAIITIALFALAVFLYEKKMKEILSDYQLSILKSLFTGNTSAALNSPFKPALAVKIFSDWDKINKGNFSDPDFKRALVHFFIMNYNLSQLTQTGFRVYLPDKCMLGTEMSIQSTDTLKILYATEEELAQKKFQYWLLDSNSENESFPEGESDYYYSSETQLNKFLQEASKSNTSVWTDFYYGDYNFTRIPVHSVVRANQDSTDLKIIAVVTYPTTTIDGTLTNYTFSKNSRIAIEAADGTLRSTTTHNSSFDTYKDLIVTKDFVQLDDPVWNSVMAKHDISVENSIHFTATVDGKEHEYLFLRAYYPKVFESGMNLYAAICVDELVASKYDDSVIGFSYYYVISIIIAAAILLITQVVIIFLSKANENRKRIYMKAETDSKHLHISLVGIPGALKEIRKIKITHQSNEDIVKEMNKIIKYLSAPKSIELLYDSYDMYDEIKNEKLFAKITNKFCDGTYEQGYGFSERSSEETLLSLANSEYQFISNSVSEEQQQPTIPRTKSVHSHDAHSNIIEAMFMHLLEKDQKTGLISFCMKIAANFLDDDFFILYNSIYTATVLFENFSTKFGFEESSATCLLVSLLIWHASMKPRSDESKDIIQRYFQLDMKKINQKVFEYKPDLIKLFGFETEIFIHRLDNILVVSTPSEQLKVVLELATYSPFIKSSGIFSKEQKNSFLRFIFNTSTISYMFASPDISQRALNYLNRDSEYIPYDCMKREIVIPSASIIRCILGNEVLKTLAQKESDYCM